MSRIISVIHRLKQTVDHEARPTLVLIIEGEKRQCLELETEREEFHFLTSAGDYERLGLRADDSVLTRLGGSGDRLSFAMSRRLEECGGTIFRIPSFRLKEFRDTEAYRVLEGKATEETALLQLLWEKTPEHFFECRVRDREIIRVSELYKNFKDAQRERMACAGRLRARLVGSLFLSEDGKYPEGKIEDWFDAQKATDQIYLNLEAEEKQAKAMLERALKQTRIADLFEGVTGCGPSIIGGLISAIGDIRRFERAEQLVSYLGLAVLKEDGTKAKKGERIEKGRFMRALRGVRTTYNRNGRQTLYTLSDQFNRRPDSEWGKYFLANKAYYREKHPHTVLIEVATVEGKQVETGRTFALEPGAFEKKGSKYLVMNPENGELIEVRGKQRYYPGHIHKMAVWKTLREFVIWLHGAWTAFEKVEYLPKELPKRGRDGAKKAA